MATFELTLGNVPKRFLVPSPSRSMASPALTSTPGPSLLTPGTWAGLLTPTTPCCGCMPAALVHYCLCSSWLAQVVPFLCKNTVNSLENIHFLFLNVPRASLSKHPHSAPTDCQAQTEHSAGSGCTSGSSSGQNHQKGHPRAKLALRYVI